MSKKHWNERWSEEVENKINIKEIEILNEKYKEETKPKSKLTMEFTAEHAESTSGNTVEL